MSKFHSLIIRIFYTYGIFSSFYLCAALMSIISGSQHTINRIYSFVIISGLLVCTAYYIFIFYFHKRNKTAAAILKFLYPLLPFAIMFTATYKYSDFYRIFLSAGVYLICYYCLKLNHEELSSLGSIYSFITISFMNLIIYSVLRYGFQNSFNTNCIISYIIYVFTYFLLKNQTNIEQTIKRRNQSIKKLPKKIYIYSLKLMIVPAFILIVIYCFRTPIASQISDIILKILRSFFSLFQSNSGKVNDIIPETTSSEPQTVPQDINNNPIFKIIFTVIILALILFIIFYAKNEILNFFKSVIINLKTSVKRIFYNFFTTNEVKSFEHTDYKDIEFDSDIEFKKAKKLHMSKLKWKRDYRKLNKIENSAIRFRKGYDLAEKGIILCGSKISDSDSVRESLKKIELLLNLESAAAHNIESGYNTIRYGETDASDIEENNLMYILKEICKIL